MTEPGETSASVGPRRSQATATVAAVVVVGVLVSITAWRLADSSDDDGAAPRATDTPNAAGLDLDTLSLRAVRRQQAALAAHDRAAFLGGWADLRASQRSARSTYGNLEALGARVRLRYVDSGREGAPLSGGVGGPRWTANVDVAWRLPDFDRADAKTTLTYTFVSAGESARVVGVSTAAGARAPVWLAGRLVVRRSAHTLVAAADTRDARDVARRLETASTDVADIVGRFRGGLVAYVPASASQLEAIIGAAPGDYDPIAAVTTTVDGSRAAMAPVAIVVNPDVYAGLGPIGRHVVLSHEATHAATGTATATIPLWVAEGFADYVGVGSVDVPVAVSAGALFRDIRRRGVPARLPSDDDFALERAGLELAYEQSWLAIRLIAREAGERRLVAFYEAVVARPATVNRALLRHVGMTPAALTQAWRGYLRELSNAN